MCGLEGRVDFSRCYMQSAISLEATQNQFSEGASGNDIGKMVQQDIQTLSSCIPTPPKETQKTNKNQIQTSQNPRIYP